MKKIRTFVSNNRNLITGFLTFAILLLMFLLTFWSSHGAFGDPGESAIVDEVAHIPAGYTYVKDSDYRLNPEHPPLAKAWSALPLILNKQIVGPELNSSWANILQWDAGWFMLYHSSNNAKTVIDWARFPMMLLAIILGYFIYRWTKKLYGRKVALIVLTLYAFYPDVLAHSHYVTTDVAAALGFTVATYFLAKVLVQRNWRTVTTAVLGLALAQLLKFSAVLLFGVFFVFIIVRAYLDCNEEKGFWKNFWQNFKLFILISFLSIIVVWVVYIPFVYKTPASIEHQLIETNLTSDSRTLVFRNFLHHFENNPILRALGHYLLGVMLVFARVAGGNNTFILGYLSDKSISWYFPVAWLLKTPITIILLVFSSLFAVIFRRPKDKNKIWLLSVILTPIIIYWVVTLKGQLNIGIRHLMPTIPFVLLLIGYFIHPIVNGKKRYSKIILAVLVCFMMISTLTNFPNFTAYFNEFTPKDQRYTRLIDSSLDWGQDLLRLKKYIDDNHIEGMKIDYFGGSVPSYYIANATEWHSAYGPTSGWLAVSATYYQSSKLTGPKNGEWSYEWLDSYKPTAIVGGSILVFHISESDLAKNPPTSPYLITKMSYPNNE